MPELWGALLARAISRAAQAGSSRPRASGSSPSATGSSAASGVLEFRTGHGFAFDVIVDRAFDIGRCEHAGPRARLDVAAGFAGPWYYEPEGLGFLRTFGGGLLTTCGLDHALFMAEDTAEQYHYPPKPTETLRPARPRLEPAARLAGYGERWDGDECVLFAEGEVLQAAVFGEQLLLRRRIEARVGESCTPDPRRGRQRRPRPHTAHAPLPRQRRLAGRRRGLGAARSGEGRRGRAATTR